MNVASITSPACSATFGLSTVVLPSWPTNSIRASVAVVMVIDFSLDRKSPPFIWDDMRLGVRTPGSHLMRMLPGMGLHGKRRAAIRIAFAQNRVDGTALDLVVTALDVLLFVVFRIFRIFGKLVALALQFLDGLLQLREARR